MRISLWQQFSSNHSARFTVVGLFENALAAKAAADELKDIVDEIAEWQDDHPNEWELFSQFLELPTPVERQIARRYAVEWNAYPLDWPVEGQGQVNCFDRLVFIDSGDTYAGATPLDGLINKMGGQVLIDGCPTADALDSQKIKVTLDCHALDMDSVPQVKQFIKKHLWRGEIQNEELKIHGHDLEFQDLAGSLPDILEFLRSNNCRDIEVNLTEYIEP